MVPEFHDTAIGDDSHLIHRRGRSQPVQDRYNSAPLPQARQGAVNRLLGSGIQGAGGLIEQQQLGVANDRASDGNALALAA